MTTCFPDVWIGLLLNQDDDSFYWVEHGQPLVWSNWFTDKPNNAHYSEDVGVIMEPGNDGRWDDKPFVGQGEYYPLCEHDL